MPAVPHWFFSNIGYHHVCYLNRGIHNYHLKKCSDAVAVLQAKAPLTLKNSLTCVHLKVRDEKLQKMIAFP